MGELNGKTPPTREQCAAAWQLLDKASIIAHLVWEAGHIEHRQEVAALFAQAAAALGYSVVRQDA